MCLSNWVYSIPYTEKLCTRCTELVGTHRSVRDKIYKQYRNDKEYQAIYVSATWQKARRLALSKANGLCEVCIKKGKIVHCDEVHHIVPVKDNIKKAYDINNLICLCRSCHREAHKELDRKKEKGEGLSKKYLP